MEGKAEAIKPDNDMVNIERIRDALYPILIPVEQQCVEIQAANHDLVTRLARLVWHYFKARR